MPNVLRDGLVARTQHPREAQGQFKMPDRRRCTVLGRTESYGAKKTNNCF